MTEQYLPHGRPCAERIAALEQGIVAWMVALDRHQELTDIGAPAVLIEHACDEHRKASDNLRALVMTPRAPSPIRTKPSYVVPPADPELYDWPQGQPKPLPPRTWAEEVQEDAADFYGREHAMGDS